MKKYIITFLTAALMSATILAQPDHHGPPKNGPSKEKIESLRRAYYTQELNLSPTEAEKFWPIYNSFEEHKKQHQKKMRQLQEDTSTIQNNNDIDSYGKKLEALKIEEAQQVTQYIKNSASAIGMDKTKILIGLDAKFKKEMGEQLKERKQKQKEHKPKGKR
ncbi:MAG: hypothetical protein RLY35_1013 [Bacteroidota bacterium]|jgi:hypothetical protein